MLVKILKGSKDKKVLEHKLDQCPVYGFYHELTMEKISERVDWVIKEDYLRIRYSGRLPVLVFSDRGWEIERETYAEEIFEKFYRDAHDNKTDAALEMAQVNRQVVFDVLEKIRASRDVRFLPILEAWKAVEVRKVRARINNVERTLMSDEEGPVMEKAEMKVPTFFI